RGRVEGAKKRRPEWAAFCGRGRLPVVSGLGGTTAATGGGDEERAETAEQGEGGGLGDDAAGELNGKQVVLGVEGVAGDLVAGRAFKEEGGGDGTGPVAGAGEEGVVDAGFDRAEAGEV